MFFSTFFVFVDALRALIFTKPVDISLEMLFIAESLLFVDILALNLMKSN
jgi:hypothetical protein